MLRNITKEDILLLLQKYDESKGILKKAMITEDQEDIQRLRQFVKNSNSPLDANDIISLLKIILTQTTEPGSASRETINSLIAIIGPETLTGVRYIQEAKTPKGLPFLRDLEIHDVDLLLRAPKPLEVAQALAGIYQQAASKQLSLQPLFKSDKLSLLAKHPHPAAFAKLIIKLLEQKNLTQDNMQIFFDHTFQGKSANELSDYYIEEIAKALDSREQSIQINKENVLKVIFANREPNLTAVRIAEATLMLSSKFLPLTYWELVSDHILPKAALLALKNLHDNQKPDVTADQINHYIKTNLDSINQEQHWHITANIIDAGAMLAKNNELKSSHSAREFVSNESDPVEAAQFLIRLVDAGVIDHTSNIRKEAYEFSDSFGMRHAVQLSAKNLLTKANVQFLVDNRLYIFPENYLKLNLTQEMFNDMQKVNPKELNNFIRGLLKKQNEAEMDIKRTSLSKNPATMYSRSKEKTEAGHASAREDKTQEAIKSPGLGNTKS